jgi:AcrR family transcriptional regulator
MAESETEALPFSVGPSVTEALPFSKLGQFEGGVVVERADAQRNRERIMEVAREAFGAPEPPSMTQLAKLAGIGVGTLYRHFPTREALIMAVYQNDIQRLIDLAPELLRAHPPGDALRLWLEEVARYGRLKYGAAEVIHAATGQGLEDPAYQPFVAAIKALLDAGSAAGILKDDLDPEDVLLQMGALWRIPPRPDRDARAARILDLIIDGLLVR